ncbi:MAG: TonB-dependent receptor [Acidobacteria bacterium]|nr:TonB-dependent receptor [Acidobacteriota bacterium]
MFRLALAVLAGIVLSAQTFNARITGTIFDSSQAAAPGAVITAVRVDTQTKKTATSAATGEYSIPLLLPGVYEVTVEAPGFQTQTRRDVRLEINQTATLDFTLSPATTATSVDVTAQIPLLQSETSGVGATLEAKIIEQYPLIERNVMGMLRSLPGVVAAAGVGASRSGRNVFDANFSVGGGRTSTNEVLLDGAPNTIGDFNGVVIVPAIDSVQEFRLETNSYSAEFGRSGGGAVNIVTRSGTNNFHGTSYYFHQNTEFNANSYTSNRVGNPRPIVKRHQYGFTFGGPVLIPKLYNGKNKTFYFFSFEGRRERDPIQGLFTIPTEIERRGDFSQTLRLAGNTPQLVRVFDPSTAQLVNGRYNRIPFPNNIVPQSRHNAIALNVLKEYPAPNRPGVPVTNLQNYFFRDQQKFRRDLYSGRVDHFFNEKHRLFGRLNTQENLQDNPGRIVQFAEVTSVRDTFGNIGIDDTYQITPTLSNVFRYSYTRFRANQFPSATLGFDPTTLGLPSYIRDNANILFYPNFSFGFTPVGGRAFNNQPRDTQGLQEQIVWTRAKHNVRAGGEYRLYRFYPFQVFNPVGSYAFGANFTQQDHLAAANPTQGYGLASFLLGTGNFSYEHVEALTSYHHYVGAYVQDDWRIFKNLTLNLGLRWDVETGTGESHNRLTYFDPEKQGGSLLFTGEGNPTTIRAANRSNFGPRVGFAYRGPKQIVARGGYGIFYLPLGLEPGLVTTPFNYTINADVTNADYTPRTTLSNPFPGGLAAPAGAARVTDGSYRKGLFANIALRDQPAGYQQQWNFALARQFGKSTVIDATYFGSRGVHLPIPSLELNQIHPDNLARGGAFLNEQVPNPFFGQYSSGLLSQRTVPRMQLLKPFPRFAAAATANAYGGSLNYLRPPVGDSIYHAVTFKLERRFSKGLSLNAHYTISKLIDIGGVGNGNAFNDNSALRDIYNVRLERSVSAWDIPQRLVINYAYDLPFGKNRFVGGWTIFSVHTLESGRAIAVGGGQQSRLAGAEPARANVVAGVKAKMPRAQSIANARNFDPRCACTQPWFNTAAFAVAPEFTIPNGPRFLPDVRSDLVKNWDLSITKKVALTERVNFVLSGDAFNVLNMVYFGAPNGNPTSNTFGSTAGVSAAPRRLQVGAKITF